MKHIINIARQIDDSYFSKIYEDYSLLFYKKIELEFDLEKVELYQSKKQQTSKGIHGFDLERELYKLRERTIILNACVLDYLLDHQEIIPEEWKGKNIHFFLTVYREIEHDEDYETELKNTLFVRCLKWDESYSRWTSDRSHLCCIFGPNDYAIMTK